MGERYPAECWKTLLTAGETLKECGGVLTKQGRIVMSEWRQDFIGPCKKLYFFGRDCEKTASILDAMAQDLRANATLLYRIETECEKQDMDSF